MFGKNIGQIITLLGTFQPANSRMLKAEKGNLFFNKPDSISLREDYGTIFLQVLFNPDDSVMV
jgi:hypothetical protein